MHASLDHLFTALIALTSAVIGSLVAFIWSEKAKQRDAQVREAYELYNRYREWFGWLAEHEQQALRFASRMYEYETPKDYRALATQALMEFTAHAKEYEVLAIELQAEETRLDRFNEMNSLSIRSMDLLHGVLGRANGLSQPPKLSREEIGSQFHNITLEARTILRAAKADRDNRVAAAQEPLNFGR